VEVLRFCQGAPAGTGLTGVCDRSDWCSPVAARVGFSAAFSGRLWWLLIPRTNSTPVAAWSWLTWVVESETCFGSCVHLVGILISFEKIFYRLPFTPPYLVASSVLHLRLSIIENIQDL
jgi:hypothetical protein